MMKKIKIRNLFSSYFFIIFQIYCKFFYFVKINCLYILEILNNLYFILI